MSMQRGVPDPYRALGVQHGATADQIKSAHRKLAKRFHPDAPEGNTVRFLAIQEAYLLLSDPLRRREWDTRHAPGPVRANDAARRTGRARSSDGRWTREEGTPGGARPRPTTGGGRRPPGAGRPTADGGAGRPHAEHGGRSGGANAAPAGGAGARGADGARDRQENRSDPDWSASGRDPSTRTYRWSAEGVPWWEDFAPRGGAGGTAERDAAQRGARGSARTGRDGDAGHRDGAPGGGGEGAGGGDAARGGRGAEGAGGAGPADGRGGAGGTGPMPRDQGVKADHGDVYSRSSGAAWSSAARQYFRKASDDLPSRGSFVYRGTQVVTGAKAREASDELLRRRAGAEPAPRQAFEPRAADGPKRASTHGPAAGSTDHAAREATRRPAAAPGTRPAGAPEGTSGAGAPTQGSAPWDRPRPTSVDEGWAEGPPDEHDHSRPTTSLLGAASVGAAASFGVTLPLLILGSLVLNPPLQPTFALILLAVAALTGALAAAAWVRIRGA